MQLDLWLSERANPLTFAERNGLRSQIREAEARRDWRKALALLDRLNGCRPVAYD